MIQIFLLNLIDLTFVSFKLWQKSFCSVTQNIYFILQNAHNSLRIQYQNQQQYGYWKLFKIVFFQGSIYPYGLSY